MTLRSFLFVPGDSEKKLQKADECSADALILDLEDSVAFSNKGAARRLVRSFLADRRRNRRQQLWVRINSFASGLLLEDLIEIVGEAPDGIMLPKAAGPEQVRCLSNYLDALEVQLRIPLGGIKILPVTTETAAAPFLLGGYATAGLDRLFGLTWGAEDLSECLGASTNVDAGGNWAFTYRTVRSMCLLAAHAAQVEAIETVFVSLTDSAGLARSCREARAEGFTGRMAIHPAQLDTINVSFLPSMEEMAFAQRVIAEFNRHAGVGTVELDGKMLDLPHLRRAEKLLAR